MSSLCFSLVEDTTNKFEQRRLPNKSSFSILIDIMFKLLGWMCYLVPGLSRLFKKNDADKGFHNQHILEPEDPSSCLSLAKSEDHHPCWQRLQRLEAVVTELLNKPIKIPPEKDDMLLESMNRIKGIEYDLQKTKKVRILPILSV